MLDAAGLTPDSVTEAVDTSQLLDAIRKISGSPGEGVIWWKDDDPSVSGDRVLLLTGQTILIANYPELDAAVYVGDSANPTASAFYRTSDTPGTVRNIAGPYLVLPDLRGYALRGLDVAASVDPDGASRDMGSIQLSAMWGHHHGTTFYNIVGGATTRSSLTSSATALAVTDTGGGTLKAIGAITDGVNGTPLLASESRIVNIACSFGIRY